MHGSEFTTAPDGGQTNATSSVLMVDDHVVFAQLVERALSLEPDLECVGIAASLAEARPMFAATQPDVVIMDVRLQDGDGIDATAEFVAARPNLRVVVLSAHVDAALMQRAAAAGATALQAKDGDLDDLLEAVRFAEAGRLAVHPKLLHQLVTEASSRPGPAPTLTQREHDVLRMLADGSDLATIARELNISLNTCRGHVKSLLVKLGAHSQLQAVVIASRLRLIELDDRGA